ncbi:MAG: endonuclease/exonuclease/phosphatase family protein [Fusobacteriaceae bacterium]
MKKFRGTHFIVAIFLLCSSIAFSKQEVIASFNVLRLGANKKDYVKLAEAMKEFKLVGLIEVMKREGLEELVDTLEKVSGEDWDYNISPYGQGSGSYKEFYGFVWQTDTVEFVKEVGFFPDEANKFVRPPYAVMFKIDKFDFIMAVSHSVFGKNVSQRRAEAMNYNDVYNYFQNFDKKEQDIIIGGDFNLPADDRAFGNFFANDDSIVFAVDPKIKTSLGMKNFANSYDNIFLSKKYTKEFIGKSGIYDFTGGDFAGSRKNVSDHVPVFIVVETSEDDD